MSFLGRAFYNLLQMNLCEEPLEEVQPWQTLDYRSLKTSQLFDYLEQEDIRLDIDSFHLYSEKCLSPEEIVSTLVGDLEDDEKLEKAYLVIFELWRRLCTDKESLSIFCDELDHRIHEYDQGGENEELLQLMLSELENILYENTKEGDDPHEVFIKVSEFLAHDLEEFIYDFAADQMDLENALYASEIVDGFYEYIEDPIWFDFLRITFVALADKEEATSMLEHLLEKLEEEPDLDLFFEILRYLNYQEGIPLFYQVFELIEPLLEKEEDFHDLLEIMSECFNSLDKEEEEEKVQAILEKRGNIDKEKEFSSHEPDFQELKKLVNTIPF